MLAGIPAGSWIWAMFSRQQQNSFPSILRRHWQLRRRVVIELA
jgi:hypothetical protein